MRPLSRGVWVVWAVASAVGTILVALPDNDARLFSFSDLHGPSSVDFVGAVILTAGWLVLEVEVLRRLRLLIDTVGRARLLAFAAVLIVGAVGLVATIVGDLGGWWIPAVVTLAAPLLAAAIAVTARQRRSGPIAGRH